jgi:integrase
VKKSTKQTDKAKALKVCLEWDDAATKARAGTLTEIQARKVVSDILEVATGEPLEFYTCESWLREWLESKKGTQSPAGHARYTQLSEKFIRFLGKRAKLNIAAITPTDIRKFRDLEQGEGKAPKSCNLGIKILSAGFNAAKRQGFIDHNPCQAVESLEEDGETKDPFTVEQLQAVLGAADDDWKGVVLMGLFTGARLSDVVNMTWDAVDLPEKTIRFVPRKTRRKTRGKAVTVPMHPQLEAYLLNLPSPDRGTASVFPALAGRTSGGNRGLSNTFRKLLEEAGIPRELCRPSKGKTGRAVSKLTFHSLRHSFTSLMANDGTSQEIRRRLVGHASKEMNDIYTHFEPETVRRVIDSIPSIPEA